MHLINFMYTACIHVCIFASEVLSGSSWNSAQTLHTLLCYLSSCPCYLFASVNAEQPLNASASKLSSHTDDQ